MKTHLTYDERLSIQKGLTEHLNFTEIANEIGHNRTTVMREVKNHRSFMALPIAYNCCVHKEHCDRKSRCRLHPCTRRIDCVKDDCAECMKNCSDYEEVFCPKLDKAPYVCGGCTIRKCGFRHVTYDAKKAQMMYEATLADSRRGIAMTEEELLHVDQLVTPLLQKGQSLPIIYENHKDDLPVCMKTMYSYINAGLLESRNIDLRRKLRRPERKKSGPQIRVDRACHIGRCYENYEEYMSLNPDKAVVQMDSVIGQKGGKVLLTILFTNCDLQLMYLRDRNTAASVTEVFQNLRKVLGSERFRKLFAVILTDRGSEFTDPFSIEKDPEAGGQEIRIFYCDPMNSNQKSNCERNHELIRYVIPKGESMDSYDQEDINLLMSHINSYGREKWNGRSPLDLFEQIYGQETATLLNITRIPPDSINLKPELLTRK